MILSSVIVFSFKQVCVCSNMSFRIKSIGGDSFKSDCFRSNMFVFVQLCPVFVRTLVPCSSLVAWLVGWLAGWLAG